MAQVACGGPGSVTISVCECMCAKPSITVTKLFMEVCNFSFSDVIRPTNNTATKVGKRLNASYYSSICNYKTISRLIFPK